MVHLWLGQTPLVLASGSRTRADVLANAGLFAEIIKPHIDERRLETNSQNLTPVQLAKYLAKAKAQDVAQNHPGRITVGADQVLEIDQSILHKPIDVVEAREHLLRLQGRTHALHSAVAIVFGDDVDVFHETVRLTMRPLDAKGIAAYVALAGEDRVTSSVGGYQLEGLGIHLFERVEGDHSSVLGLPLIPLLERFRARGLLAIS